MLNKITLIDYDQTLVDAWKVEFANFQEVEACVCDYFEIEADAMVSPANSFGIMDGGLDRAITYELGAIVQDNVQEEILKKYHGELPVGCAVIVETGSNKWPYLISAPTMRVPEDVSNSVNAYLAFRAIILEIAKHNEITKNGIKTIVCSGLGTGVGNMNPVNCARQMRMAYEHCLSPAKIPSLANIHTEHFKMRAKKGITNSSS